MDLFKDSGAPLTNLVLSLLVKDISWVRWGVLNVGEYVLNDKFTLTFKYLQAFESLPLQNQGRPSISNSLTVGHSLAHVLGTNQAVNVLSNSLNYNIKCRVVV
jgi:hypothetical protein